MTFDWWTFGLQIVNFIILVWLLKVFLYGPVLEAIARRQEENSSTLERAQEAEKLAQSEIAKFNTKCVEIEASRKQILADVRIAESRAYDKLIQEGQVEVSKLRTQAQKEINREHHKAQIEMRQGAADLAVTLARHILQESHSVNLNELFLEKIVTHLKSMPPTEFNNIRNQLGDGAVGVKTAEKLDVQAQKKWGKSIGAVFDKKVSFTYTVDKSLIAGASIHFPNSLISFNWRDTLDEVKLALYARVDS